MVFLVSFSCVTLCVHCLFMNVNGQVHASLDVRVQQRGANRGASHAFASGVYYYADVGWDTLSDC